MIRFAALATVFTLAAAPVLADPAASSLTLTFETAARDGGVMVALYDSQAAFDGGQPVPVAHVDVGGGDHDAVFADLPAGEYAAKTFHDVDGDGAMDKNQFGMPAEPYIRQAVHAPPQFAGQHVIVGSWVVGAEPAVIALREDPGRITRTTSRFVPHFIR